MDVAGGSRISGVISFGLAIVIMPSWHPSTKCIRLYDLRHSFATMTYHKTRDILYTKQQMGHRKIETTLIYMQLLQFDEDDNYTCKIAQNVEQATELNKNGFEYVTEIDCLKLFRKRK